MPVRESGKFVDPLIEAISGELRAYLGALAVFDHLAAEKLGTNPTDTNCVHFLHHRERMTAGELADGLGLTSGAVTAVLDRLERLGYIERERDLSDRRRVYVRLTARAHELADAAWEPFGDPLAPLANGHARWELALIRDFLRSGRELIDARAAEVRAELRSPFSTRARPAPAEPARGNPPDPAPPDPGAHH